MSDKSNRQSLQFHGSVWMAHWMRTNCDVPEQTRNPIKTKTFEIVNESLKTSSKSIRKAAANGEGGTSKNPCKWLKTDSKSLQEIYVESSSHIMPYGFDFKQSPNANMTHGHEGKVNFNSESDNACCSLRKMHNCVITEVKGNVSSDLRPISSFFGGHGNRGVKIQSLSNSTDNEEKKDVRDVKVSKVTVRSESSAETNTIDMDSFHEKNPCIGTYSISSKTQSLDIDNHFATANHPIPKSNLNLENSQDPSNTWVKRLKLNSSQFSAQATKSPDFPENSTHKKMGKIFSRILKTGTTSEEQTQSNKDDEKKQGNELLLSHAWIQRWLSNRSKNSEKKAKTVVFCEPQSSKFAVEKEHYPSIAAMALMGKAITGFQQCELQKRGSFTVWNTKAF